MHKDLNQLVNELQKQAYKEGTETADEFELLLPLFDCYRVDITRYWSSYKEQQMIINPFFDDLASIGMKEYVEKDTLNGVLPLLLCLAGFEYKLDKDEGYRAYYNFALAALNELGRREQREVGQIRLREICEANLADYTNEQARFDGVLTFLNLNWFGIDNRAINDYALQVEHRDNSLVFEPQSEYGVFVANKDTFGLLDSYSIKLSPGSRVHLPILKKISSCEFDAIIETDDSLKFIDSGLIVDNKFLDDFELVVNSEYIDKLFIDDLYYHCFGIYLDIPENGAANIRQECIDIKLNAFDNRWYILKKLFIVHHHLEGVGEYI